MRISSRSLLYGQSATVAAWVSKAQIRKFVRLVPEFVVELLSPSDRLPAAKKKMAEWLANDVALAWLIDADKQTLYIYRAGQESAEKAEGLEELAGEGPVSGFYSRIERNVARSLKKGPLRLSQQAGAA